MRADAAAHASNADLDDLTTRHGRVNEDSYLVFKCARTGCHCV
jgi:hypothetical protein